MSVAHDGMENLVQLKGNTVQQNNTSRAFKLSVKYSNGDKSGC